MRQSARLQIGKTQPDEPLTAAAAGDLSRGRAGQRCENDVHVARPFVPGQAAFRNGSKMRRVDVSSDEDE